MDIVSTVHCRAGAIWRSHASPDDVERCEWDKESYLEWMRIVKEEPEKAEQMGLKVGVDCFGLPFVLESSGLMCV